MKLDQDRVGGPDSDTVRPTRVTSKRSGAPLWAATLFAGFWLVAISVPSQIQLGGTSLSALLTLAGALALLLFVPFLISDRFRQTLNDSDDRYPLFPLSLGLFGVMATLSVVASSSSNGVQNWAVYISFIMMVGVAGIYGRGNNIERLRYFLRVLASLVAVAGLAMGLLASPLYLPRPFAIVGILLLAIVIPGRPENWLIRLSPYICIAAITLSLSRTATVIALLLLAFLVLRGRQGRRLIRAIAALTFLLASAVILILAFPPLRDRFLGGDAAVDYGGLALNTSGRSNIWAVLQNGLFDAGPLGHGIGTASDYVVRAYPEVAQPHNDYLRILFDLGLPGLLVFSLGIVGLVVMSLRKAVRFGSAEHWTSVIALTGIGAMAFTDNPFVYPFAMIPLGLLVGLSAAAPYPRAQFTGKEEAPVVYRIKQL